VHGAFLDFVIDLRVGSPTFGASQSVRIDDVTRNSVYLSEGLGHTVVALTDGAVLNYLVSSVYDPTRELTINPFDDELALQLPPEADRGLLSPRDLAAPSLSEARERGLLPTMDDLARIERP
jgi:dTDP-4-dehydrorhamnose 3,5-epimerase